MALYSKEALAGKRILVTGGGTGLGKGVAGFLAEHGAHVHLWGRRQEVLDAAAAEINEKCGATRAFTQSVDIRKAESVDAAIEQIWTEHGPLTGLINNAAANFIAPTKDISPRAFEAITSTVMNGAFYTTHACGKRWIAQGLKGSIVSTLVTWVWTGSAYVVPSAMAKAAVNAMTMSLAVEWARYGIRINAVAPGPFPTEYAWQMLSPTDDVKVGATSADEVPMGRYGEIKELANLMILLLSDECDYITGETVCIDGGHHLAAPSTFAGLNKLSDEAWDKVRETSKAASATAKAQRTV
ncbi:SDR family oxidoreductase [Polycyclovorans algicola]|uniref:SDR family oxidoreductase n=1 Tax=Polycyclovorans algicola TaxID=616992 RepID=UPI0004A72D01|nr:SDR family oxidoreductase [Polycyclovorans algicola]